MQTVLITGAARGIGHDTALALAKRGHRVIATTHTEAQAETLLREAEKYNVKLETEKLDITSAEDIEKVLRHEPDVLINNAAIGESGPMSEVPLERVNKLFQTNVVGTLHLTQRIAMSMIRRKKGRIVIVGSVAGRLVLPYLGPYNMTKFAIEAMADALRLELKQHGIKVSLIEPGLIFTGFNEQMAETKYSWISPNSAFTNDIKRMRRHDAKISENSYSTTSVVEAMIHAVEAKHPRARYVRPKIYQAMIILANLLPTGLRDRIMRRSAGV